MNENTALRMLSAVMEWDLNKSQEEHQWLRLISAVKYDGYRDFQAGMRFLESLVGWLLQFESKDRPAAYEFVRNRLVFISTVERERLVEIMYPQTVLPRLLKNVAMTRGIAPWQVYTDPKAKHQLDVARQRTLFLGLSDGARLDSFRHVNVGRISNEQVVVGTQLDAEKWQDLRKELQKSLVKLNSEQEPTFDTIYLVDDFAGSGTSFIRTEEEEGKSVWKGKLLRFLRSLGRANDELKLNFQSKDWTLVIHHLIVTDMAVEHLKKALSLVKEEMKDLYPWFANFEVTWSYRLPSNFPLTPEADPDFFALTGKYYDPRIETDATRKGGVEHLGMGYAGCALPLVLDHNTPNNTVALVWAESDDEAGPHEMHPLFYRRQRHTK
ncbi:phosphoribosyltransferase-like protein [Pinirhizobacter soli]|uniref:phosphoribosyltransferase-like protein n=1 Tax=Pinirhizobacter soli TaxID=2786953 RepID=UPI00202A40A0|nr:hypothetical protein [Pinirhizobacter soli]